MNLKSIRSGLQESMPENSQRESTHISLNLISTSKRSETSTLNTFIKKETTLSPREWPSMRELLTFSDFPKMLQEMSKLKVKRMKTTTQPSKRPQQLLNLIKTRDKNSKTFLNKTDRIRTIKALQLKPKHRQRLSKSLQKEITAETL